MRHRAQLQHPLRAVALCAAVLASGPAGAADAPKGISIRDAWLEEAPHQSASGFFTIENVSQDAVIMTGFSSPACRSLMLQESGVISHAAAVTGMTVTSKGALSFARGGYHLNCSGPSDMIVNGATVPVTVAFNGGKSLTVSFKVRPPAH